VPGAHFLGDLARFGDVYEFALVDSGTPGRCLFPVRFIADEFRPVGEGAALERFRRVDRAAAFFQKFALSVAGNPEAPLIFGAVDVAEFESFCRHPDVVREARDILFGQVDKTLLFTAFRATGLAGKPH
jgi:hypothetical protein